MRGVYAGVKITAPLLCPVFLALCSCVSTVRTRLNYMIMIEDVKYKQIFLCPIFSLFCPLPVN